MPLVVVPLSISSATLKSTVSNSSTIQSISSATWKLCAGATNGAACTGSAYGPTTPVTTCTAAITKTESASGTTGTTLVLNNTTSLVAGMVVSGTGIGSSTINWIATVVNGTTLTLGLGGNTLSSGATITFATCTGFAQFLSLNNNGTSPMAQVNVTDTPTGASGTMAIQSCNTGGVGTTVLAWSTEANGGLCVGEINTIVTATNAIASTASNYSLVIAAAGSARVRALSSVNTKTLTVSTSITKANLTTKSTNG